MLIGRTTHHLAVHVDGRSVAEFAVVFGLIWLAWFNGTLWHELHGREDGRSRNYIFLQMGLLALLAVFAGEATAGDGRAVRDHLHRAVRAVDVAVVPGAAHRRRPALPADLDPVDRRDDRQRRRDAGECRSPTTPLRVWLWAVVVVGWVIGGLALVVADHTEGFGEGVTQSLVERMGLFTIIVLGEVVVGVVGGISDAEHRDALTITTGMIGLTIGMGMWWNYFDMLGRRVPGRRGRRLAGWLYSHLPLTMAISASGAAMVSLLEHAGDSRTPAATGWLLVGSVVIVLGSVTLACTALPSDEFPAGMARYIAPAFAAAAAVDRHDRAHPTGAHRAWSAAISAVLLLVWLALFAVFLALGGDPDVTDFELGHDTTERAATRRR